MTGFRNAMMGAAGAAGGGFAVDNSAMFNEPDDEYFTRTPSSASNQKTWTFSTWIKRGELGADRRIFTATNNGCELFFDANDKLNSYQYTSGSYVWNYISTQVFRDPHAWYHIVVRIDTTQASSGDRVRLYVNGEQITVFDTSTAPSQDATGFVNSAVAHYIGRYSGSNSMHYDGYLAETVLIDGSSLAPTSFGETDSNGVWRPIDVSGSGLTFGTNGFYFPYTDSGNLGGDYQTGGITSITLSGEWNGDTGDFGTLDTDIIATGGNQGAIRTNDTFTGDFAFDFTWKGGANPAYVGVYEIDEDGTFSTGSSDGGMGSMTDSFYLLFTSGNAVNALKGSSTESSSIFTAASGEVIKFQRSGSQFKVFENGVLRHTFTGTSSNEVRILIGQSSSSLDWENFRWVTGGTTLGNPFTPVNSPTQTTDTPTNNHCVWSDVFPKRGGNWTLSEGNRKATYSSSTDCGCPGSIGVSGAGTWYFEITASSSYTLAGIVSSTAIATGDLASSTPGNGFSDLGGVAYGYYANNGYKLGGPSNTYASYGATFANTDVIGVAFDAANGTLTFYKNGSTQGQAFTGISTSETWFPFVHTWTNEPGILLNNGQTAFAHTAPSGYVGINTTNLLEASAPTIEDGSAYFQSTTYTGNVSANRDIAQTGNSTFQPDFFWGKNRVLSSHGHRLFDAVRGVTKVLQSSAADIEATDSNGLTAFNSNGFEVGNGDHLNGSGNGIIGWQWKAGDSNTVVSASGSGDGAINACTHRANQTAGFSIVKYEGANSQISNGSDTKVTHGLGAKPELAIIKNIDADDDWMVLSTSTSGFAANSQTGDDAHLHLNTDDNINGSLYTGHFETGSNATHFEVGNENALNTNGENYIAYVFRSIPGFSKVGSYKGGVNSTDGIYVNLGFRPAWLMLKNYTNSGESWYVFDNQRPGYNDENNQLIPNSAAAEGAGNILDLLSNGFKIRANDRAYGGTSATDSYFYLAFAEHPFAATTPATAR